MDVADQQDAGGVSAGARRRGAVSVPSNQHVPSDQHVPSQPPVPLNRLSANEISTKRQIWSVFVRAGSARVLLAVTPALLVVRAFVGRFGRGDLVALGVTIALAGTVEWVIHKYLLHAPDDSFRMRRLGTGRDHRAHHLNPDRVGLILLSKLDAVVFLIGFAVFSALWGLPLFAAVGAELAPSYVSALTLAALGLLHYEWTHLMVHTRYRPKTRLYASLARNHRLHHFRNENYWLGVTSNTGDRILRTLPAEKGDVPLSETARTLS